jgi:Tol biopolymer transport system component
MPPVFRYVWRLSAVALVFALACGVSAGVSAGATPAPEGPRLAFTGLSTLRLWGFTVRTVGSETSRPLVLVRGSRQGVVPKPLSGLAWSADGSWLAFVGTRGMWARRGIYLVRPDGTGLRFLRGTGEGSNPVFSPDGRKIAFSRTEFEGLSYSTVWVANVNGSGARRVVDGRRRSGFDYLPSSFSPDGSTLALTRESLYNPPEPRALLLGLRGEARMRLLARWATEPVFSPDGSQIIFVRHSIERPQGFRIAYRDLYLTSDDGKTTRPLTRTRWITESHPSWDPSGQRIAFNSFRISKDPFEALFDGLLPEGNSIVQVNADGSCREKVFSIRGVGIYGAAWQPGPGREAGRIECR